MDTIYKDNKPKRGRPPGKPKPLNADQKRGRNAQYERERRCEEAEGFTTLRQCVGLSIKVTKKKIIASAIVFMRTHRKKKPLSKLRKRNEELLKEYMELRELLGKAPEDSDDDDQASDDDSVTETEDDNNDKMYKTRITEKNIARNKEIYDDDDVLYDVKDRRAAVSSDRKIKEDKATSKLEVKQDYVTNNKVYYNSKTANNSKPKEDKIDKTMDNLKSIGDNDETIDTSLICVFETEYNVVEDDNHTEVNKTRKTMINCSEQLHISSLSVPLQTDANFNQIEQQYDAFNHKDVDENYIDTYESLFENLLY